MKVMAAAAALRSKREMSDGMRVLAQSCEWRMDKRVRVRPYRLGGCMSWPRGGMLYEVHVRNAWEGHITAEARLNSAVVRWDG